MPNKKASPMSDYDGPRFIFDSKGNPVDISFCCKEFYQDVALDNRIRIPLDANGKVKICNNTSPDVTINNCPWCGKKFVIGQV